MINLDFFHKFNYTGEILIDMFGNIFNENFHSRVMEIEGIPYIHMKVINEESQIKKVVNSQQSIKNCYNTETTAAILGLNNINYGNKSSEIIIKSYDILVFDMSIISIRQVITNGSYNPDKYIRESECPKASELGKKAIYLLGLDYAMITIAQTGKRKFKVLYIDPSPVIRNKDLNKLVSKIESIYNYNPYEVLKPIKLGADPEFMLFNSKSGKMVAASEFFPREGIVGCDNIRVPNRQQRPVAEIRPDPDLSPHNLINNIRAALQIANKIAPYRNLKWLAGSHPTGNYSIGGHIHFSNITLNYSLLRALDNYLGIPIFLIENSVSAARRRKRYGLLADYRIKEYGGFEYRTPGSWLVSPEVALAVLCLAKVVSTHHLELNENYLDSYEAQSAFYQGNQEFFKESFDRIWPSIIYTDTYVEYSDELNIIFDMVSNSITWDEKSDFREVWKITRHTKRHYNANQQSSTKAHETIRSSRSNNNNNNILQTNGPVNERENIERPFFHSPSSSQPAAGRINERIIVSHRGAISNYSPRTQ